jgi:hypothetical protein
MKHGAKDERNLSRSLTLRVGGLGLEGVRDAKSRKLNKTRGGIGLGK